jgi:hypothetical protein
VSCRPGGRVNTQTLQGGFGNPNPETGQEPFFGATNAKRCRKRRRKSPVVCSIS